MRDPRAPGRLEQAVRGLLAEHHVPGATLTLDRSPKPNLGEIRVKVDHPDARPPTADTLGTLARALESTNAVKSCVVIPPRIYVKLRPGFVLDTVSTPAPITVSDDSQRQSVVRVLLSFSDPNV